MAGIAHEVKLEILGKVKAGEAVLELSKQYGVSDKTIYRWLKEQLGQAVSFAEYNRVRRENRELKQILGVLTFELEKVKKSSDLAQAVLGKYPGITRQLVARVFQVSRQWLKRAVLRQPSKDALLQEQILKVWETHPSYGHRRLALALGVGKKRVRRVMQRYCLKPYKRKARWRKRRDERRAPALFQNQIKSQCPLFPNYAWAGDFTYLPFKGKFLYLATFMDLFTREIVGWSVAKHHTKTLVIQALLDSVVNRQLARPRFVHTDQGGEYTSQSYTNLVHQLGIQVSMSKKQSPWENGFQESFYNTFKTDLGLEFDRFYDEGEFLEAIHHTIQYYNHDRIHTALKMSPNQFYLTHRERMVTKRGT